MENGKSVGRNGRSATILERGCGMWVEFAFVCLFHWIDGDIDDLVQVFIAACLTLPR